MKRKLNISEYKIDQEDYVFLSDLANGIANRYGNINNPKFMDNYYLYTQQIQSSLRKIIFAFKKSNNDCLIIKGVNLNDKLLCKTPEHWKDEKNNYVKYLQFLHFIVTTNIGYPYGWKTQQNGSIATDILPISGLENHQLGFGSEAGLRFHTEDPFHEAEADFISLMCMRNDENIPTNLFPVDLTRIPLEIKHELFKKQFNIVPDESHTELTYGKDANSSLFKEFNYKRKISILYGDLNNPYLRIDPEIMDTKDLSDKAKSAYDYICNLIDSAKTGISLKPGEIIIINNHSLAHGRGSFKAKYNGRDRWLERMLVIEDLRKTISYRENYSAHVMVK